MDMKQYMIDNEIKLDDFVKQKLIKSSQFESEKFDEFITYVEENKSVGINVRSELILDVFKEGEYLNIFQLGKTDDEIKKKYNEVWKDGIDYYSRLCLFLKLFDENKLIKYCSINTGNLGLRLSEFGGGHTYIVLRKEFVEKYTRLFNIYCLAEYSLFYFDENLSFLFERFSSEISSFDNVEDLAFYKHYLEILKTESSNFKDLIAGGFHVIEVLVFNKIKVTDIETIRISTRIYDSLITRDFKNLSEAQRYRYMNLKKIIEGAKKLGIKINYI